MLDELGRAWVLRSHAPARTPTQVERKRREVVSVGLRSCPSIARRSSTTNCVGQLRSARGFRVRVSMNKRRRREFMQGASIVTQRSRSNARGRVAVIVHCLLSAPILTPVKRPQRSQEVQLA